MAADSSGNGRPAGYRGSYTLGATGPLVNDGDPGVSLTGGSVGQLNAGPGLPTANAPRSLEAWVKTTSSGPIVMYGSNATNDLFELNVRATSLGLVTINNDHWFTTPYAVANGTWHHVIVTYDGAASVTMYLDGSSLGTQTFASPLATVPDANGLLIGNDYWGSLSGSVDDVAVYPKALTAAQVLAHFSSSGNSKPTAPTNVSVTPGANQLTVTWNPSVTSPNAPVTQYVVTGLAGSRHDHRRQGRSLVHVPGPGPQRLRGEPVVYGIGAGGRERRIDVCVDGARRWTGRLLSVGRLRRNICWRDLR